MNDKKVRENKENKENKENRKNDANNVCNEYKKFSRQQFRRLTLLISLLLFPVTMWYFSPYIIMIALSQHILNGSFITFTCMLIFSMFFGRVFCGYICPAGGLQECAFDINGSVAKGGWRNYIKFGIWLIWLCALGFVFFTGTGRVTLNPFFMTDHGISIAEVMNYITYYMIILLLLVPALIHGRRATCHYICWMAPFMIIGSKIGRFLHLPQLHIEAKTGDCISCKLCNKNCPMGLEVEKIIREKGNTCCGECINCGKCVDSCPKKVLSYSWRWK